MKTLLMITLRLASKIAYLALPLFCIFIYLGSRQGYIGFDYHDLQAGGIFLFLLIAVVALLSWLGWGKTTALDEREVDDNTSLRVFVVFWLINFSLIMGFEIVTYVQEATDSLLIQIMTVIGAFMLIINIVLKIGGLLWKEFED